MAVDMEIKAPGSGCNHCHSTIGIIERGVEAVGIDVEIVKVESPDEIKRSGVSATPAVMIDGKVVHSGDIPSQEDVQNRLKPGPIGFLNHPARHLFFTGKGGLGKTTVAAALALGLIQRGKTVHLSTTDPAAHLAGTLNGDVPALNVSRIDPKIETQRYLDKIMAAKSPRPDAAEERLRRACKSLDGSTQHAT